MRDLLRNLKIPYYRLRSTSLVWGALNTQRRRAWRAVQASLPVSPLSTQISQGLQKNGIALTSLKDLLPEQAEGMLAYAAELNGRPETKLELQKREGGQIHSKLELIVHIYGSYGQQATYPLETSNPIVKGILDNRVLTPACMYLGYVPMPIMHSLHSTVLVAPGDSGMFSQRWHRDPEDSKMVKMFIYMNDVLETSVGPFTYVKGSQEGGKYRNLYPQKPPAGCYPPDGEVEKYVAPSDILPCLGKAGTVIFCDTSGFHKGGLSTSARRLMYAATFASQACTFTPRFRVGKDTHLDSLGVLGRIAVDYLV